MGTWWQVPREWPGATAVCLAPGPSLTSDAVGRVLARRVEADGILSARSPRVIAINDAYRLAPWAEYLYACDAPWWALHGARLNEVTGRCVSVDEGVAFPWVHVLRQQEKEFSTDPAALQTGSNSGFQALNLAYLLGAARVLLAGYDMRVIDGRSHFFGEHPDPLNKPSPYHLFVQAFRDAAPRLKELGLEVINCTPGSALDCFPFQDLEVALDRR